MKLYLDVEFNGHGGELISLALAAEDGKHWYGVPRPQPLPYEPWVLEHVAPHLIPDPSVMGGNRTETSLLTVPELRASLREYLLSRAGCTIIADWPDDFAHLMRLMSGPAYEQSFIVPCTMVLLAESEPQPEIPHNALSDAIALMRWHQSLGVAA